MAFWYSWHPGDYARDTADLSPLEDLYFRRLLDSYYATGTLPADYYRLYAICRAVTLKERAAVKLVSDRFFIRRRDGNLSNRRADKELAKMAKRSEAARNSAKARWDKEHEE